MEMEVIEFYPSRDETGRINFENGNVRGSLHVYVSEWHMDIRGISVYKNKEKWLFKMPWKATNNEEGQRVSYPCVSFTKAEIWKGLLSFLHTEGKKFITNKLNDDFKIKINKKRKHFKNRVHKQPQTANS